MGRQGEWAMGRRGETVNTPSHPPLAPSPTRPLAATLLSGYRAIVVGGRIDWSTEWVQRLTEYVRNGGTVVINAAQAKGIPEGLSGAHATNEIAETYTARCLLPGDES